MCRNYITILKTFFTNPLRTKFTLKQLSTRTLIHYLVFYGNKILYDIDYLEMLNQWYLFKWYITTKMCYVARARYDISCSRILRRGGSRGNGSEGPNAGGPGAKARQTVVKFHFLKGYTVLENESIFQK